LEKHEKIREDWRKHGAMGKFHNTIRYVRSSPQLKEEFADLLKGEIAKEVEGKITVDILRLRWWAN
jgi:hypothetical protein